MRLIMISSLLSLFAIVTATTEGTDKPWWKTLPVVKPEGDKAHTGSHVIPDRQTRAWKRPDRPWPDHVSRGRKESKVVVVIYNPVLESEGGKTLVEHLGANDSRQFSRILADVIRQASWGYIDYQIVDTIEIDGYTKKVDGFRYTDDTFLAAREKQEWQPSITSYRAMMEENGLVTRCRDEGISEIWLWGASGMHWDEFAGYIPNRYARFGPTDNPWFYRPYDIPEEVGHTLWVMGFNYEVGADNMIHSYTHRVESMAALALAEGVWNPVTRRDPWNVFSWLEMDHEGVPSQVGNCHVPPNGQSGYDYNNPRTVLSWAGNWDRYPDLSGPPRKISNHAWGQNQFGFQKWILERIPKGPGHTRFGWNNWWVYIANTDEDLPERPAPDPGRFVLPRGMPDPEQ